MKKGIFFVGLSVLILSACISQTNVRTHTEKGTEQMAKSEAIISPARAACEQMAGGWIESEVSPQVREALDSVLMRMNTLAKLKQILRVQTQVVAGINYAIEFEFDNGEVWHTQVFRSLKGEYSMTKPAVQGHLSDICHKS
ncbi:cystatin domain-containing protein [Shewanella violacea]|uniref:Cystatin domain-containing protein n=1 Tax=Shewanella violacea (strain JCM 10179 / CIP 106290 / LMG 19151 / DSS12) TaxID=637905 RepID=D4ZF73_SHEVD|nr:cystatin domain-containing protein [Shewanella violacea]BAJ04237.1 conserved hypothetical protein [Shewanella violacea DSS12]